jgi:hypothetical protein
MTGRSEAKLSQIIKINKIIAINEIYLPIVEIEFHDEKESG